MAREIGWLGWVGMMVFFGCMLVYGEVEDSPQWLVWPAAVALLIGVPLSYFMDWRDQRSDNPDA